MRGKPCKEPSFAESATSGPRAGGAAAAPGASSTARTSRTSLVRKALGAQLGERALALLQPADAHPLEDPAGLRELDVAVVDDLEVVAPRVAEVVVAEHFRARLPCRRERRLAIVDDQA